MIRQVTFRTAARLGGLHKAAGLAANTSARCMSASPWAEYAMAPLDPIIGLNEEYNRDDFPNKVIVGVGAYRSDEGKPYVLPCVREAEERIFSQKLPMEYSGIVSFAFFLGYF
jgi:aspartate aminotransferase, mitochondrial